MLFNNRSTGAGGGAAIASFFLKERSSSSLFLFGSVEPAPFGKSICSAFCLAALSC
jgi:hypothetical protein